MNTSSCLIKFRINFKFFLTDRTLIDTNTDMLGMV